jgi:hypothetical protein
VTLEEYLEHLYGMATGWLGWSPAAAWAATVPEVLVAVRALVKWQKMLNGTPDETPEQKAGKLKAFMDSRVRSG